MTSQPGMPVRRILVVDDEENIRFTCTAFLDADGHELLTAGSGEDARRLLDDSAAAFDLVFLDICLGRENGLELLDLMQARFPLTPVVIMTGAPDVMAPPIVGTGSRGS